MHVYCVNILINVIKLCEDDDQEIEHKI